MVNLVPLSNVDNIIPASTDSGQTDRFRAIFSRDRLSSLRGVISVLLDLGRLIDKALAMWHSFGLPMPLHS